MILAMGIELKDLYFLLKMVHFWCFFHPNKFFFKKIPLQSFLKKSITLVHYVLFRYYLNNFLSDLSFYHFGTQKVISMETLNGNN